jgi:trimeric autotransporter adhesin
VARLCTSGFEAGYCPSTLNMEDPNFYYGSGSTATASVQSATKRSGNYALSIAVTGENDYGISYGVSSLQSGATTWFARCALNFASFANTGAYNNGTGGVSVGMKMYSGGSGVSVFVDGNGQVVVAHYSTGSTIVIGPTLQTGQWYVFEFSLAWGTGAGNLWINGSLVTSFTADVPGTGTYNFYIGVADGGSNPSIPGTLQLFVDDFAVNDDTGTAQNGQCGLGNVVLLVPVSDSAEVGFTNGAGAASSLYAAVSNEPPKGVASASSTATSQIKDANANTTDYYQANLQSYSAAGVPAGATILVCQPIANHGRSAAIAGGNGLSMVSNPAIAEVTSVPSANASKWPTNWLWFKTAPAYNPAVTLTTGPVLQFRRNSTGTGISFADFLGMYVEYLVVLPVNVTPAATATTAASLSVVTPSPVALTLAATAATAASLGVVVPVALTAPAAAATTTASLTVAAPVALTASASAASAASAAATAPADLMAAAASASHLAHCMVVTTASLIFGDAITATAVAQGVVVTADPPLTPVASAQTQATAAIAVAISCLTDAFPGTTLDTTKWQLVEGSAAVAGGQLQLGATSAYTTVGSLIAWTLKNSAVLMKLWPLGPGNGSFQIGFDLFSWWTVGANKQIDLVLEGSGPSLTATYTDSGGTQHTIGSGTWTPGFGTPAWLRIRESGGTTYFDYSSDGMTWTNLCSIADPIVSDAVGLQIYAGYYGTETAETGYVADVNLPPGIPALTASAHATTAATLALAARAALAAAATATTATTASASAPTRLTSTANASTQATLTLSAPTRLTSTASATTQATLALSAAAPLSAAANASAQATVALNARALLSATANAGAQATVALNAPAPLSATAAGLTAATVSLLSAPSALSASASATAQATATVQVPSVGFLTPGAIATTAATATASVPVALAASAQAQAQALLTVLAPALVTVAAQASASATVSLGAAAQLAASAGAVAQASASISATTQLIPGAQAASAAALTVSVPARLALSAQAGTQAAADLVALSALSASALAAGAASCALTSVTMLAPVASASARASATVVVMGVLAPTANAVSATAMLVSATAMLAAGAQASTGAGAQLSAAVMLAPTAGTATQASGALLAQTYLVEPVAASATSATVELEAPAWMTGSATATTAAIASIETAEWYLTPRATAATSATVGAITFATSLVAPARALTSAVASSTAASQLWVRALALSEATTELTVVRIPLTASSTGGGGRAFGRLSMTTGGGGRGYGVVPGAKLPSTAVVGPPEPGVG